jgi:ribosomal protein S18 acetylase RimI-like enzyme
MSGDFVDVGSGDERRVSGPKRDRIHPAGGTDPISGHRESEACPTAPVAVATMRGEPDKVLRVVEPLLLEYLRWCVDKLQAECGFVFHDQAQVVSRHHDHFCRELPDLLGSRGRLSVVRAGAEILGVAALKPVDDETAELKRMYVRPRGRGHGAGRALLTHLLAEARALGYGTVRLETAIFMTEAQRLYESMGFRQRARFPGGEANLSGLDAAMRFLELRLEVDPTAVARRRTLPAAQGPGHHGREQDRRDSARGTMAA